MTTDARTSAEIVADRTNPPGRLQRLDRASDAAPLVADFVRDVVVPAGIRAGGMLVQLVVLAWLNGAGGPSLLDRLTKWDGLFYSGIASAGYPQRITIAPDGSLTEGMDFAFHPLFPGLAGALHLLGVPARVAVVLVACVAGLAAAVVIHLLTKYLLGSRRAGYFAVALLGVLPASITLQMGYAESLYLALAGASVLFALRGRWWLAAGCAFAAGLTRPTALVLAVVVPLARMARRTPGPPPGGTVSGSMALRHRCLDRGRGWCAGVLGVAVDPDRRPGGVVYRRRARLGQPFRLRCTDLELHLRHALRAGWVSRASRLCDRPRLRGRVCAARSRTVAGTANRRHAAVGGYSPALDELLAQQAAVVARGVLAAHPRRRRPHSAARPNCDHPAEPRAH